MTIARERLKAQRMPPPPIDGGRDAHQDFAAVPTARAKTGFAIFCRLPALTLLLLIQLYQKAVSPFLPVFFGAACGCRFVPSCSHYAAEAIRTRGATIGVILAAIRLAKCTPLHPGGFDPVPPRHPKPRCERIVPLTSASSL